MEVAELLVRHIGELKFRHAAQEIRPQQRPGEDMVSQILGSREKRFFITVNYFSPHTLLN